MAYSTIKKPSDYFNTVQWTGNNTSTRSITGVGFQPDLTWKKERNASFSIGHMLYDSVRGLGVNKHLDSSTTGAEGDGNDEVFGYFTSFDTDGFSVSNGSSGSDYVNNSSYNYVAWNWLASNTTASNTDGSITSTVSANTTSGFSIVSYTGTGSPGTVGHGLGTTPSMIIVKDRTTAGEYWHVYHKSLGATKSIYLNVTDAAVTTNGSWNNTEPTSTVFSIGTVIDTSSANLIAYCFAEKQGFSKFGSYTGNGNADGTFVYTGFKPAFVMIKRTDSNNWWHIFDNKRDEFNLTDKVLYPNASNAEATIVLGDILSNGFKLRQTDADVNGSGASYIYMAFAESPLVGTNNIPAVAR